MPAPLRSDELQRPRERAGNRRDPVTTGELQPISDEFLQPDPDWHPIARKVWDGALSSGQYRWYQNSDLAILYSICEDLSIYKDGVRRSGQMLQVIMSTLGDLMVTEGDRRRVRLELQEPKSPEQELHDLGQNLYEHLFSELEQSLPESVDA